MNPEPLEEIQKALETERDLRIKLGLLQAAATLRATPDPYTVLEAVAEAKKIWEAVNDPR